MRKERVTPMRDMTDMAQSATLADRFWSHKTTSRNAVQPVCARKHGFRSTTGCVPWLDKVATTARVVIAT